MSKNPRAPILAFIAGGTLLSGCSSLPSPRTEFFTYLSDEQVIEQTCRSLSAQPAAKDAAAVDEVSTIRENAKDQDKDISFRSIMLLLAGQDGTRNASASCGIQLASNYCQSPSLVPGDSACAQAVQLLSATRNLSQTNDKSVPAIAYRMLERERIWDKSAKSDLCSLVENAALLTDKMSLGAPAVRALIMLGDSLHEVTQRLVSKLNVPYIGPLLQLGAEALLSELAIIASNAALEEVEHRSLVSRRQIAQQACSAYTLPISRPLTTTQLLKRMILRFRPIAVENESSHVASQFCKTHKTECAKYAEALCGKNYSECALFHEMGERRVIPNGTDEPLSVALDPAREIVTLSRRDKTTQPMATSESVSQAILPFYEGKGATRTSASIQLAKSLELGFQTCDKDSAGHCPLEDAFRYTTVFNYYGNSPDARTVVAVLEDELLRSELNAIRGTLDDTLFHVQVLHRCADHVRSVVSERRATINRIVAGLMPDTYCNSPSPSVLSGVNNGVTVSFNKDICDPLKPFSVSFAIGYGNCEFWPGQENGVPLSNGLGQFSAISGLYSAPNSTIVRVIGHTSSTIPQSPLCQRNDVSNNNIKLSAKRAETFVTWLNSRPGAPANNKIVVLGSGSAMPLIPGNPQDPRNQRIELVLDGSAVKFDIDRCLPRGLPGATSSPH